METETTQVEAKKRGRPAKIEANVDDTKETVHTFLDAIARAKMEGEEWIETSADIIAHYNRQGLNGAKFFIFDGIKVCEKGTLEALLEEINQPMQYKLHGDAECAVDGRG